MRPETAQPKKLTCAAHVAMAEAQTAGLLTGRPAELGEQFAGLLWRDLMVSLLLGVVERPNSRDIAARAREAAAAFLQLHPPPKDAPVA